MSNSPPITFMVPVSWFDVYPSPIYQLFLWCQWVDLVSKPTTFINCFEEARELIWCLTLPYLSTVFLWCQWVDLMSNSPPFINYFYGSRESTWCLTLPHLLTAFTEAGNQPSPIYQSCLGQGLTTMKLYFFFFLSDILWVGFLYKVKGSLTIAILPIIFFLIKKVHQIQGSRGIWGLILKYLWRMRCVRWMKELGGNKWRK